MTEANQTEQDPLATSCDDIDISYPLLPTSNYEMGIKTATVDPNKKLTGDNLVVSWANTKEHQSTKGDIVAPGQVILKQYIGLTETDKYHAKDIAKSITRLVKAVRLSGVTPRDIINNPSQLVGKTAIVKVGIRKETEEFAEANEVKSFVIEG